MAIQNISILVCSLDPFFIFLSFNISFFCLFFRGKKVFATLTSKLFNENFGQFWLTTESKNMRYINEYIWDIVYSTKEHITTTIRYWPQFTIHKQKFSQAGHFDWLLLLFDLFNPGSTEFKQNKRIRNLAIHRAKLQFDPSIILNHRNPTGVE